MSTVKKAASIVISVVMWIIILIAALFAFTTLATKEDGSVSNLAGFTPLTVQSDSMAPTFDENDLIFIQQCDPSSLQVGDIVTFHDIIDNQYALNTHRIIAINEVNGLNSYTTKGDNNELADQHVIADGDIVGKYVFKIPYLGKVIDFLSSTWGFLIVIVVPMLLFFIYQVYHLVIVGMNLKRAMTEEDRMKQAEAIVDREQAQSVELERAKAEAARAEAEAVLAEAKRLKAEAEAKLASANSSEGTESGSQSGGSGFADSESGSTDSGSGSDLK